MESSSGVQAKRLILFWVINWQAAETETWNVELVEHEVTTVVACEFTGQVGKTAPLHRYCQSDRAMHRQLESHCCRGGCDSEDGRLAQM